MQTVALACIVVYFVNVFYILFEGCVLTPTINLLLISVCPKGIYRQRHGYYHYAYSFRHI